MRKECENFQKLTNIMVCRFNIYNDYMLIDIGKWGGIAIDEIGRFCDDINSPIIFKIVKLKDD